MGEAVVPPARVDGVFHPIEDACGGQFWVPRVDDVVCDVVGEPSARLASVRRTGTLVRDRRKNVLELGIGVEPVSRFETAPAQQFDTVIACEGKYLGILDDQAIGDAQQHFRDARSAGVTAGKQACPGAERHDGRFHRSVVDIRSADGW